MIIRGDATRIPLPDNSVDAVVTDPPYLLSFMGTGTTMLAAHHEGFRCIGIEREEEYVEIARGRISQPVQQGML